MGRSPEQVWPAEERHLRRFKERHQGLSELAGSGLAPLAGLAGALHEDRHAVVQGITTPYNSGVNEGRITGVKLQKRIMAGRSGVSLLRHRVA